MARKITKKELKEPDFLQKEFAKFLSYVAQRKKEFIFLTIVFIVILIGAMGWFVYHLNYEKMALKSLREVEKYTGKTDIPQSIEMLRNIARQYPHSKAALYAYYKLGNLYLTSNQLDLALRSFEEFIKKTKDDNYFKVFALRNVGYCYELKNNIKLSIQYFEKSLNLPYGIFFAGQIYRDLARLYEKAKDYKNAIFYYQKSLEKTTDPTVKLILKRKIASL